jgi:hypothetical protein
LGEQINKEFILISNFALASSLGGKRYKDDFILPFDTTMVLGTLMKAMSNAHRIDVHFTEPREIILEREIGCPAPAKKRKYPCTVHSQLQNYFSALRLDSTEIRLVPVFYIDRQAYDVPAEGYVAYTFADSFHDLHYTWYTLMVNIFKGDELIYYDQHSYFTEEILPEDETPEIHIPQAAMDSLVTLTMQGYVDGLRSTE